MDSRSSFVIRDEIAHEHDLRGPELGALVFRLGELNGGVLQTERDGLARRLVLVDSDLHRVYAVGTVEHAERGDAVVGAVAVEASDGAGGFFAVNRYSYVNTSSPPAAISAWRRKSGSWGLPLSVTDFTRRPLA